MGAAVSRALQAAVYEARERMHHFMDFARHSMEQIDKGMQAPTMAEVKAYRDLTLMSLRKLTKFPRAMIPRAKLVHDVSNSGTERPLAELARQAIAALTLGLVAPDDLIYLIVALGKVHEVEPAPGRRRGPLLLPERTGGPTVGDLFGERR